MTLTQLGMTFNCQLKFSVSINYTWRFIKGTCWCVTSVAIIAIVLMAIVAIVSVAILAIVSVAMVAIVSVAIEAIALY